MPELRDHLERARRELLDLSTRNRLLSVPVSSRSARVINVVDELTTEVFRLLVRERKSLSFVPSRKSSDAIPALQFGDGSTSEPHIDEEEEAGLPPPDDEEDNGTSPATEAFLSERAVPLNYSPADLAADSATLEKILTCP